MMEWQPASNVVYPRDKLRRQWIATAEFPPGTLVRVSHYDHWRTAMVLEAPKKEGERRIAVVEIDVGSGSRDWAMGTESFWPIAPFGWAIPG